MKAFPTERRRGRRVALVAHYPPRDPAMPRFISNHGLRMIEASLRRAAIPDLELHVYDLLDAHPDALVAELLRIDPDVVGFSSYLWSFPLFVEVARRLKEDDPSRVLVMGGPSARPSMFELEPFRTASQWFDALVIQEGEATFTDLVRQSDRTATGLAQLPGVAIRHETTWLETPAAPLSDLSELASPYQMGLVPPGGLGVLQTYRGCPFTCSFCEWGTMASPRRARHVADLEAEFHGMDTHQVEGALLVDAGLNLNQHAFLQLNEAAERTDFFRDRQFICEVYPAKVQPVHLEFLSRIGCPLVGVGLQSFDNEVLAHVERSYDAAKFEQTLYALTEVAGVALEIIMGLPGDSPEKFQRSFERARQFPCALRVYHCVVLPSALMIRSPPEHKIDYDPITLKMRSCWGWTGSSIDAMAELLTRYAQSCDGTRGEYFWVFPPP